MKLIKALVVMLVAVGMILPAVAVAEDRLSLSGEMRVRAFHEDFDSADDTDTWANQRLRIAGKIAVAEGVSVTFRTDITEGTDWGNSSNFGGGIAGPIRTNGAGHARSGAQQQWDRAHLDIEKGMFHLRAGQQYVGTFGVFAVDTQDSGLRLDIKTENVPISTYVIVDNDNGGRDQADAFLYGVTITPKIGEVSTRFFGAGYNDGEEEEVYLLGASASMMLGPVNLFGEFDYFTGDANDAAGVDAFGTQLMLDGSMALSDMITLGGQFYYAAGDDEDVQYVFLGNGFNGWDPIYDVGTSLSNEEIVFGRPFDFTGLSAGVVGGRLYGKFKLSDAINLGASASYLSEEEDEFVESDGYQLAAGLTYGILENTSFQVQLQYEDMDLEVLGVSADYDSFRAGTGIFVKF